MEDVAHGYVPEGSRFMVGGEWLTLEEAAHIHARQGPEWLRPELRRMASLSANHKSQVAITGLCVSVGLDMLDDAGALHLANMRDALWGLLNRGWGGDLLGEFYRRLSFPAGPLSGPADLNLYVHTERTSMLSGAAHGLGFGVERAAVLAAVLGISRSRTWATPGSRRRASIIASQTARLLRDLETLIGTYIAEKSEATKKPTVHKTESARGGPKNVRHVA